MEKNNLILVTNIEGKILNVNISNKSCKKFGFKHGDRIFSISSVVPDEATVMGVAKENKDGEELLWVAFDHFKGKVSSISLSGCNKFAFVGLVIPANRGNAEIESEEKNKKHEYYEGYHKYGPPVNSFWFLFGHW